MAHSERPGGMTRRIFLPAAGATVAAALARPTFARAPSGRLRLAILGVNSRGVQHVPGLLKLRDKGVEIVAVCDPDRQVLSKRAAEIGKQTGTKLQQFTDLRKVFDDRNIDAVTVATPNHWHTLAAIWGCQAGKHVYVEKPGSHNVFEGQKLVEAAHKYKKCVQHGVQLRSSVAVREAVEHLKKGTIGDVYMARGLCYRNRPSVGKKPDADPPKHLDWGLWLGPAADRRFSERYVHYNWHWHWDFGNGDIGNQGVHQTDLLLWGLGVGLPTEVQAMGGRFLFNDDKQTPEVLTASFLYPEQKKMIEFEVRPWATNKEGAVGVGCLFYGSKGYMQVDSYNSYETFLYDGKKTVAGPKRKDGDPLKAHIENWVDAIYADDPSRLNGPVETAHISSGIAHLANIAYRLGRRVRFDPKTETFGDAAADAHLTREYRSPFVVPARV